MRQLKIAKNITSRNSEALDRYLTEIARSAMLTPDEEAVLAQTIRNGGKEGERARDRLVSANLRFVVSVAKQYQHQGISLTEVQRREAEHKANVERINAEQAAQREAERKAVVPAMQSVNDAITREFSALDAKQDAGPTIKLGEICTRLGFTVTADFIASLGVSPVATEKNAKLYDANKFPTICRLISDHVLALAFKKAA